MTYRWLSENLTAAAEMARSLSPAVELPLCVGDLEVRQVSTKECGDPLIDVSNRFKTFNVYRQLGITSSTDPVLLRSAVVERLGVAERQLPPGFSLAIIDGWRSLDTQRALLRHYGAESDERLKPYVASADDADMAAPHTTGGAVDLTLSIDNVCLGLGSDFDEFEPNAHFDAFADGLLALSPAGLLRRVLYRALLQAGFAPYPEEWWHWSFGDQRWAAQYGKHRALFGTVSRL